ncbi:MAG TPA: glycosyltransferase family 39 protein [Anaerolineales bacterium]|nr:glycosyltransferase family 39 protein [Anaerolineales bacterium]
MKRTNLIRLYFWLATLEGVLSFLFLLLIPGDTKKTILFGLSPARLFMSTGLLVAVCGAGWVAWKVQRSDLFAEGLISRLQGILQKKYHWQLWMGASTVGTFLGLSLLQAVNHPATEAVRPYLIRLAPLVIWGTLLSAQTLVLAPLLHFKTDHHIQKQYLYLLAGVVAFGIFGLLTGVIAVTRIGILPPRNSWGAGWGDPGVPILSGQSFLVIGIGLICWGFFAWARRLRLGWFEASFSKGDWIIVLLIWGLAAISWSNVSFETNWFAPTPRPPNFERFPYSDAALHDVTAQNLLAGEGLRWGTYRIPRRPLYALLLAAFHALVGQEYDRVIQLQVVLLALFPVVVYLLGTALHHRVSGIVGAGLIIFREINAISLSDTINVSHSKLMMSDLPAALLVCTFTLLCVLWLQKTEQHRAWPLIGGGVLGLTMLVRTQVFLLMFVPLAVNGWICLRGGQIRRWVRSTGWMCVGVFLAISPWLWRNWQLTGGLAFEETEAQLGLIASRLSPSPDAFPLNLLPGENEAEYANRMTHQAVQFFLAHPGDVATLILSNFTRSQVSTVLMLPASFVDETAQEFVRRVGYWFKWEGPFRQDTLLPIFLNLGLVALGLGTSWVREKGVGLLPLGILLVYSLSNALATISGWRFMLPADWVGILYFSIGLVQLCFFLGSVPFPTFDPGSVELTVSEKHATNAPVSRKAMMGFALGIFLIGGSLPIAERIIPTRYPSISKSETVAFLTAHNQWGRLPGEIRLQAENTLADPDSAVLWGRALYPRYFPAGQGEAGGGWPAANPRTCERLAFHIIGEQDIDIFIPQARMPTFPNATDVLVIGFPGENVVEAVLVIPIGAPSVSTLVTSQSPSNCPP